MGAAGGIAIAAAVFYGLTFLPALLAILGPRVNWLTLPVVGRRPVSGGGVWHGLASWVMRRPFLVLVPALGLLVAMGIPFLHLRLANGSVDELPAAPGGAPGLRQPGQEVSRARTRPTSLWCCAIWTVAR